MKKFFTVALAALVLMSAAACETNTNDGGDDVVSARGPVASDVSEMDSVAEEESSDEEESSKEEVSSKEEESSKEDSSKEDESEAESEAEIDTSKMDNPYVFEKMAIDLPSDFDVDSATAQQGVAIIYSTNEDNVGDNFTFTSAGGADDIDFYTQDTIESTYGSMFDGFEKLDSYEVTTCDGEDAIVISYNIKYSDIDMRQNQLMVFTDDDCYIVTYTTTAGENSGANDELFNECVKSVIVD